jgi:hypothetical protein
MACYALRMLLQCFVVARPCVAVQVSREGRCLTDEVDERVRCEVLLCATTASCLRCKYSAVYTAYWPYALVNIYISAQVKQDEGTPRSSKQEERRLVELCNANAILPLNLVEQSKQETSMKHRDTKRHMELHSTDTLHLLKLNMEKRRSYNTSQCPKA